MVGKFGAGEDAGEAVALGFLFHAVDLEFVHALAVPVEGAGGAVGLEGQAELLAHDDSTGLQRAPGAVLEFDQRADVVLVLDRAAGAALADREVGAFAGDGQGAGGGEGFLLGDDPLYGADEHVGHVDGVGHHIA